MPPAARRGVDAFVGACARQLLHSPSHGIDEEVATEQQQLNTLRGGFNPNCLHHRVLRESPSRLPHLRALRPQPTGAPAARGGSGFDSTDAAEQAVFARPSRGDVPGLCMCSEHDAIFPLHHCEQSCVPWATSYLIAGAGTILHSKEIAAILPVWLRFFRAAEAEAGGRGEL